MQPAYVFGNALMVGANSLFLGTNACSQVFIDGYYAFHFWNYNDRFILGSEYDAIWLEGAFWGVFTTNAISPIFSSLWKCYMLAVTSENQDTYEKVYAFDTPYLFEYNDASTETVFSNLENAYWLFNSILEVGYFGVVLYIVYGQEYLLGIPSLEQYQAGELTEVLSYEVERVYFSIFRLIMALGTTDDD